MQIKNGEVLVGSDGHYWPGPASVAHRAFVKLCRDRKPAAVIMNGDAFDGATISRHPPIGWENNPKVHQELRAVKDRLAEIVKASGSARMVWPLGNHDARFETRLAQVAAEYAEVDGMHLSDHIPGWEKCWSCWINNDVIIQHRPSGTGTHAAYNTALKAGKTTVTSHLHRLQVTAISDANGTRWGVDTGTLSDPYGKQFVDYTEDRPRDHRSGFIVLSFINGKLMWPEIVNVVDKTHVCFRGKLIEVPHETSKTQTTLDQKRRHRRGHA